MRGHCLSEPVALYLVVEEDKNSSWKSWFLRQMKCIQNRKIGAYSFLILMIDAVQVAEISGRN